jgi:hypothetical protein
VADAISVQIAGRLTEQVVGVITEVEIEVEVLESVPDGTELSLVLVFDVISALAVVVVVVAAETVIIDLEELSEMVLEV